MSFGFSVGDFIAAGKLIGDIVKVLRSTARFEYQELMLELDGLQRALYQIENLEAPPERQMSVVSIKIAALTCTHVLDEFAGKLHKFEGLARQSGSPGLKIWTQKLRWGFTMADEVRNLRGYLATHVGSLNMRLLTEELYVYREIDPASELSELSDLFRSSTYATGTNVEKTKLCLMKVQQSTEATSKTTQSIQSTLEIFDSKISNEVVPQLKLLVRQVRELESNANVLSLLVKTQEIPPPALQYTYFQDPVKFEDALGRVFPIPSEFDWLKVDAIINAQFQTGPGHAKVVSREYEIFDPLDSREVISKSNFTGLRPGMSLIMAFVIGRYSHSFGGNERCPRPGCLSSVFASIDGRQQCMRCNVCFDSARTKLPLPYRKDSLDPLSEDQTLSTRTVRWKKRVQRIESRSPSVHLHEISRKERVSYKNIRLCHLELPPTPPVANFRRHPTPKSRRKQKLQVGEEAKLFPVAEGALESALHQHSSKDRLDVMTIKPTPNLIATSKLEAISLNVRVSNIQAFESERHSIYAFSLASLRLNDDDDSQSIRSFATMPSLHYSASNQTSYQRGSSTSEKPRYIVPIFKSEAELSICAKRFQFMENCWKIRKDLLNIFLDNRQASNHFQDQQTIYEQLERVQIWCFLVKGWYEIYKQNILDNSSMLKKLHQILMMWNFNIRSVKRRVENICVETENCRLNIERRFANIPRQSYVARSTVREG